MREIEINENWITVIMHVNIKLPKPIKYSFNGQVYLKALEELCSFNNKMHLYLLIERA